MVYDVFGYIKLSFNLIKAASIINKTTLQNDLWQSRFSSNVGDFKIICHDQEFTFDKTLLIVYSNVFARMVENPTTKEAMNKSVEIDDFSPSTIETFKKILFTKDVQAIESKDISVELLMFADKYQITPLFKLCKDHLLKNVNMENLYPLMEAADLLDDQEFIQPISIFILNNKGEFDDNNPNWKEFQTTHSQCFLKIMNFIMFDYYKMRGKRRYPAYFEDEESD